jgi:hypothetical protein
MVKGGLIFLIDMKEKRIEVIAYLQQHSGHESAQRKLRVRLREVIF